MKAKYSIALMIAVLTSFPFTGCKAGGDESGETEIGLPGMTSEEALERAGLSFLEQGEGLEQTMFSQDLVSSEPFSPEDINSDFSNTDDLSWLIQEAGDSRVVLIGETHYSVFIENIKNRILFALNSADHFPLVVFEHYYSTTPFINYYLDLEDDSQAESYLENELSELLIYTYELDRLRLIRQWNSLYPNRMIHVGCSDIEHDYPRTLERIVLPYLRQVDGAWEADLDSLTPQDLLALIPELRMKLDLAAEQNIVGEYPFITADYIENVLLNLQSTGMAKADREQFFYHRQRAIVRNLTAPEFLGEYFLDGRVLIFAGYFHTGTHGYTDVAEGCWTEGAFFNTQYELSAGNTYSLLLIGYAWSLGEMAEVDLNTCGHLGTDYSNAVISLTRAWQEEFITRTDRILMWPIDHFDRLLLSQSAAPEQYPVRLTELDIEGAIATVSQQEPSSLPIFTGRMDASFSNHDGWIVVPWSPLTVVIPR